MDYSQKNRYRIITPRAAQIQDEQIEYGKEFLFFDTVVDAGGDGYVAARCSGVCVY